MHLQRVARLLQHDAIKLGKKRVALETAWPATGSVARLRCHVIGWAISLRLVLARRSLYQLVEPVEKLVERIVAAVWAVPCQQEVDVLARVFQLGGKVECHGECCVAVD